MKKPVILDLEKTTTKIEKSKKRKCKHIYLGTKKESEYYCPRCDGIFISTIISNRKKQKRGAIAGLFGTMTGITVLGILIEDLFVFKSINYYFFLTIFSILGGLIGWGVSGDLIMQRKRGSDLNGNRIKKKG